jgi:chromosome segregation ATPase
VQAEQPFEGIVTDAILERRMEILAERLETQQATLLDRLSEQFAKRNDARFVELFTSLKTIREERDGILASIREFRNENGGLLSRIAEVRNEIREARAEWTPFKNFIERLQSFVWAIIGLVIAC